MDVETIKAKEHLKLLVIFHYILAGISTLGILFLILHYSIFATISKIATDNVKTAEQQTEIAQFNQVFQYLIWIYVFAGIMILAYSVLNFLSARCIKKRKNKTFSYVVAGINCLNMPLGIGLAIFTFITLGKESVFSLYKSDDY